MNEYKCDVEKYTLCYGRSFEDRIKRAFDDAEQAIKNAREITCINDIRKTKDTINKAILNIDHLTEEEMVEILKTCDERLSVALKKLEIN